MSADPLRRRWAVACARARDLSGAVVLADVILAADETLMTRVLPSVVPEAAPVPPGFTLDLEDGGGRWVVRLVADGRVVAEGTVAVLGADAAYHAIETLASHQRQGLARWVLARLDAYAVAAGATTGLLAASEAGRGLYQRLGWRAVGTSLR